MPPGRLNELWQRLRALAKPKELDRDLEDEVAFHLAMREEKNRAAGLDAVEARYAARRQFGNATSVKENSREMWTFASAETLWPDIRFAVRALRKSPGFAVVAVLTLALGIGAPAAIFSVIDSVMLRPLPFSSPEQLVRLSATKDGNPTGGGPSPLDVRDFATNNHTFQQMVVYDHWRKNVSFASLSAEPEQMVVGLVPAGYFEVLNVHPLLGRTFTEEENEYGKHYVAAISAVIWKNQFASDPAILGRRIRINDERYTIIAVMPDAIPEWLESKRIDIWTPFAPFEGLWSESSRGARDFSTIARLKPGVALKQAQADLDTIAAGLAATQPIDRGIGVIVRPLTDTRVGTLGPMLFLLMGAVSLILLIACSNLANLLLARNSTRQREFAVRAALGAGRKGLIRQLLAETLLLSLVGGASGLALAQIGLMALRKVHPNDLPQLAAIGIHSHVLLFTLLTSLFTCLLFGLAPAFAGRRLNLVNALREGGRSNSGGPRRQRLRNALVATEMALSLMLLVGASLLVQSIVRLERQNLGVRPHNLLKGHFYMPPVRYPDSGAITRFSDQFAQRVRTVPSVVDASVTTLYPPGTEWTQMFSIEGRPAPRVEDIPTARFGLTDAHFLRTLGIPLLRGRDFSESDTADSPPVVLVNDEFRRRYFANQDPVGLRIRTGPPPGVWSPFPDFMELTVIGVIGNFKNNGLARPPDPQIVVLYCQHPAVNYGFKDLVIRTASDPHLIAPEIGSQLHDLDADMPFAEVQTLGELIEDENGEQRFTTVVLALFTVAGLALAVVGIYGVVSFLVTQRTQELAVRLAVGARPVDALWLVVRQGLKMATAGAAIGLLGAWAARQLTSGLLFGVSPVDPLTFAGAAAFLLLVAGVASAIPGMRVTRIDPARALRQE